MMCVARSEHLNIEWIDCNIDHLGKGGYVVGSVGLSVCLSVCGQHYSESYERNEELIKLWWWSGYSTMSKWAKNTS